MLLCLLHCLDLYSRCDNQADISNSNNVKKTYVIQYSQLTFSRLSAYFVKRAVFVFLS